jgi:hypothetical protein
MNIQFQDQIPASFNNQSKVWIYQSSRQFAENEVDAINEMLHEFTANWKSHGAPVKAFAQLFFNQFIVLMADETATQVGGCSTDSSVRVIKSIEQQLNVQLLDRQSLAFIIENDIELVTLAHLIDAVQKDKINGDTLYFNNTILTKDQLLNEWIIPARLSWLAKRVSFTSLVA